MLLSIIKCCFIVYLYVLPLSGKHMEPTGIPVNETTSCEDFGRFARFNPYSLLNDEWMIFYYWAPIYVSMFVKFFVPTTRQLQYIKYILEGHVDIPVNWTARHIVMRERSNQTNLLVEQEDRGQYLLYELYKGLKDSDILKAVDLRIKQTGDNRIFGIMICERKIVYAFARVKEVPKKKDLQDEASRIGFRGRGGKSYLYQGHQWMPIPEAEDSEFDEMLKWSERKKLRNKH